MTNQEPEGALIEIKSSSSKAISILLAVAISIVVWIVAGNLIAGDANFLSNYLRRFPFYDETLFRSIGVILCLISLFSSILLRKKEKHIEADILFIAGSILLYFAVWEISYVYTVRIKDNISKFPMSFLMTFLTLLCALYSFRYSSLAVGAFGIVAGMCSLFTFSSIRFPFVLVYSLITTVAFSCVGLWKKSIPLVALSVFCLIVGLLWFGFIALIAGGMPPLG
jgi:hypothetical protein